MDKAFIALLLILLCNNIIIISCSEESVQRETNLFSNFDFGNIIWLDDTNSTSVIEKENLLYVIFYLSNDQNSLNYMPEFMKSYNLAKKEKLAIKFGKIEVSKSPIISSQYGIQFVPSIALFHNGEYYPYKDDDGASEKLLKFMFKKAYDGIYDVESVSQVKEFIDESRLVLLSTLKDKNSLLYKSFSNYTKIALNIDFVSCRTDECIKEYGEDIYLFKKFDEQKNRFSTDFMKIEDADEDSIKLFLSYYAFEYGGYIDQYGINMINDNKKSILIYFRNPNLPEYTKYDIIFKEVGIELRAKEVYTAVAGIENYYLHERLASEFKVDKETLPTLVFYDINNNDVENIYMQKSITSKDLTKEKIKQFVENIRKTGKLKLVTKHTYNKEVIEQKKNVVLTLVDQSVPKQENNEILTLMKSLAQKYNPEEYNIVFDYMDISQNQPPDIDIKKELLPISLIYKKTGHKMTIVEFQYKDFENLSEGHIENKLYEILYKEEENL